MQERGTSHISVVDGYGNAAAMTTSIEAAFGSRQMVRGFLLNNQLTDFSFAPAASAPALADGVRNRLQPGKRPRSSMSPTLVFEKAPEDRAGVAPTGNRDREGDGDDGGDGDAGNGGRAGVDRPAPGAAARVGPLVMVTGSPGGSAIINYVAKTLVATLQDGLDPLQAIALPNVGSRNGPTELEQGRVGDDLVAALKARAHPLRIIEATSGVQSIVRQCPGGSGCVWTGAADPRREGTARGE